MTQILDKEAIYTAVTHNVTAPGAKNAKTKAVLNKLLLTFQKLTLSCTKYTGTCVALVFTTSIQKWMN